MVDSLFEIYEEEIESIETEVEESFDDENKVLKIN